MFTQHTAALRSHTPHAFPRLSTQPTALNKTNRLRTLKKSFLPFPAPRLISHDEISWNDRHCLKSSPTPWEGAFFVRRHTSRRSGREGRSDGVYGFVGAIGDRRLHRFCRTFCVDCAGIPHPLPHSGVVHVKTPIKVSAIRNKKQ